jgi:beta-glucanase (GH16 family)
MGPTRISPVAAVMAALALGACQGAPPAAAAPPPQTNGPLTKAPDGRPLSVTFADEFDGFSRFAHGQGVWRTWLRGGDGGPLTERTLQGNKELQLYVDPDWRPDGGLPIGLDPFAVHDGILDIRAEPAPAAIAARLHGYRYVSGMITTQPSFSQTYGYFEMRAKLPRGKGVWPAFWLLPADLDWPPEIDVMESVGDPATVYVTAHSHVGKAQGTAVPISPDGFHTFSVSWDKDQLIWFVDGREVKREPTPPDMHKPMYMLANVALGGDWAGAPDATTPFPATLRIDYIRAYRFAP